jgi:hypothetical protein
VVAGWSLVHPFRPKTPVTGRNAGPQRQGPLRLQRIIQKPGRGLEPITLISRPECILDMRTSWPRETMLRLILWIAHSWESAGAILLAAWRQVSPKVDVGHPSPASGVAARGLSTQTNTRPTVAPRACRHLIPSSAVPGAGEHDYRKARHRHAGAFVHQPKCPACHPASQQ